MVRICIKISRQCYFFYRLKTWMDIAMFKKLLCLKSFRKRSSLYLQCHYDGDLLIATRAKPQLRTRLRLENLLCTSMSTSIPLVGPGFDSTSPHNSIWDQRYNKALLHVLYVLIHDRNGWEDPTHSTCSPSCKPKYLFSDNSGQKATSTELNSG